jgi:hypothetical protein
MHSRGFCTLLPAHAASPQRRRLPLQGGYEGNPFTTRFAAWLNDTFPHPDHKFVNLGLPAVTSALFAACYDSVPQVRGGWVGEGHS